MGFLESLFGLKRGRRGRPPKAPEHETRPFPTLMQLGMRNNKWCYLYKPTPRNLRYFSHSPFARRAINAIKNPIKMLEGVDLNSELEKQIEIATTCFQHPNYDEQFPVVH